MKTIFEKRYLIQKQAFAAAAKEFGADWAERYEVTLDVTVMPARYQVVEIQVVAPKSEEEAQNEVLERSGEPKQHLTFAEALAESGEQLGDLIEDSHTRAPRADERVPGYVDCPHCHVHLSNGVIQDGDCTGETTIRLKKHLYECMGCGEEFGPLLDDVRMGDAMANATMDRSTFRFSTIKSPVKRVWHIADSMPKAARKEVIAECIRQGVGAGTARTQYQAWFKASQESNRDDIRKPYEKSE